MFFIQANFSRNHQKQFIRIKFNFNTIHLSSKMYQMNLNRTEHESIVEQKLFRFQNKL